jgi:hypothetical protein
VKLFYLHLCMYVCTVHVYSTYILMSQKSN